MTKFDKDQKYVKLNDNSEMIPECKKNDGDNNDCHATLKQR